MVRRFAVLALVLFSAPLYAQSVEVDDNPDVDQPVQQQQPPSTGREKAKQYFSKRKNSSERTPSGDTTGNAPTPRYLSVGVGTFFQDQTYHWGALDDKNTGKLNAVVTYRIGEWVNSMDANLRLEYTNYTLDNGDARKLSIGGLITFPDANSRFPLYFGVGGGLGLFVQQVHAASPVAFDWSVVAGVRLLNVIDKVGFFVETGLKNHILLTSEGQFNGVFVTVGSVFAFLVMRILYRPIFLGAEAALKNIFLEGFPADKVIQRHFKANRKWGSQDRRLFAELIYDLVRWWRRLLFCADIAWPTADRWTSPDSAAFQAVIGAWCAVNEVELDRAIGLKLSTAAVRRLWQDPGLPRAVRESVPDWLDRLGESELGERWAAVLPWLNSVAPVFLRANRLKTTPAGLQAELAREGFEARLIEDDCLELAQRANVFKSKSFALGHFELQDRHSQKVAPALAVEPGQRVIDACAGAGGKTLHLAALMADKGKIIALDVGEKKMDELRARATRAGAGCIEARWIDSTKVVKRLHDSADRLLLDVPCSGLGVFRRNPDSKWKLSLDEIVELRRIQGEILQNYSALCKSGGRMVYATCSLLPSENERQVKEFLSRNETQWRLESEHTLWPAVAALRAANSPPTAAIAGSPAVAAGDGFYFAVLSKS